MGEESEQGKLTGAGSIRIPSLCCGLYGFRPTSGRTPDGKQAPIGNPGLPTIMPTSGPLANDIGALEIFMKSIIDSRPALLDPMVLDVPWRSVSPPQKKLRFGVVAEDPLLPLHPPVKKAVSDTADLLRSQGHEIVPLTAEECMTAAVYDVATQLFSLDKTSAETLVKGGEPLVPSLVFIRDAMREVKWDRSLLPDTRSIEDPLERLSFLNMKRYEIQDRWKKMWVARGLNAVIGPGGQTTAVEHDMYALAPYTCLFNFLDVSHHRFLEPPFLPTPPTARTRG
jgi:amidase